MIAVTGTKVDAAERLVNERNKQMALIFFFLPTDTIIEINNKQVDYAKDLLVVMLMCNLMKNCHNLSKKIRRLWKNYKNDPKNNSRF